MASFRHVRRYQFEAENDTFRVTTPWGRDTGLMTKTAEGNTQYLTVMTELDRGEYYEMHHAAVKAVLTGRIGPNKRRRIRGKVLSLSLMSGST